MNQLSSIIAIICLWLPLQALAQQTPVTGRIVAAADSFLSTLDSNQRKRVLYSFNDDEQRQKWSNFPTGVVPRGGISFKQMTDTQRDAAMKLLAIVLSPMGLEKVNEIRQADDDFKANGSKRGPGGPGGRGQGGPPPGAKAVRLRDVERAPVEDGARFRATIFSEAAFTTSRFLARLRPLRRGCSSLAAIISP